MNILISGGHLTPALALLDYISAQKKDHVCFVGREYSQPSLAQKSQEQAEVERRGVKFMAFHTGKLSGSSAFALLAQVGQFLQSLGEAQRILEQEKPDVFVSFGGYLAVPLALMAWIKKIPIVTHEQTVGAGQANRLIAKLAKKVAISHQESAQFFPAEKVVLTGNPVRASLFAKHPERPEWALTSEKPVLFITGGNQGARAINQVIGEALPELTKSWTVIHQCGNPIKEQNYRQTLEQRRALLPTEQQQRYVVREWLSDDELSWVLQQAKVVIARAGANTVQELGLLAKPALFIPLPFAHHDEQRHNAEVLVKAGTAVMLEQETLNADSLMVQLEAFLSGYERYQAAAQEFAAKQTHDGAEQLYQVITQV